MKWRYNPIAEEQWSHFKVIRAGANDKTWLVPVAYNTSGRLLPEYELLDTLTERGNYTYDVYLVNENGEHKIYFTQKVVWDLQKDPVQTVVYFPFVVARKTDLQVSIRDPLTGRVLLNKYVSNYSLPGFEYDFAELIKSGKFYFEVQVQDLKTKRKGVFEQFFEVDKNSGG